MKNFLVLGQIGNLMMMNEQAINSELRRMSAQLVKAIPFTREQMDFLRAQTEADLTPNTIGNLLTCFRQIGDPANVLLIEHYLGRKDPSVAGEALWVLCWLGQAERLKPYILEAVEPGFSWDGKRDVASDALMSAGHHLRTHRDRDLAQLILRWATREEDDMFYLSPPAGQHRVYLEFNGDAAQTAAGIAVGADPAALVDDHALREASLKRFIAERQDG